MRRKLIVMLAILMVIGLFAGCGGSNADPKAPNASENVNPTSGAAEDTNSPYNFAAGKFEVDANGLPTGNYEYELPITTSDEVLTFWTACYTPQWLPSDTTLGEMPGALQFEEKTGVNIEYVVPPVESMAENFSTLLAADDLCDITTHASAYYGGLFKKAVLDEEYFVNLYDYKDYCPNFIYEIIRDPNDTDLIDTVFEEPGLITQFIELKDKGVLGGGFFTRGDWLADWGLTPEDIVTVDDLHNILMLSKTDKGLDYPMFLYSTVESYGFGSFLCFDTYLSAQTTGLNELYVVDGQVKLANMNDNDLQGLTMLNKWYNEGLIDPDWMNYASNTDADDKIHAGKYNYIMSAPTGAAEMADALEPDDTIGWVPLRKPLLSEDKPLHLGLKTSRQHYGTAAISATCANIPLAVSWVDYRYSPAGAFDCTWGVEGVTWEYDENGKPYQTEFIYGNQNVPLMMFLLYATFNTITDPGLQYVEGQYAYPGGEKGLYALEFWAGTKYDGAYEWPKTLSIDDFDETDRETYTSISPDIVTYISENYPQFIDNSKPLSAWDSYVQDLIDMGINEVVALYQKYYNAHIAA